jgi:hypothetical protein
VWTGSRAVCAAHFACNSDGARARRRLPRLSAQGAVRGVRHDLSEFAATPGTSGPPPLPMQVAQKRHCTMRLTLGVEGASALAAPWSSDRRLDAMEPAAAGTRHRGHPRHGQGVPTAGAAALGVLLGPDSPSGSSASPASRSRPRRRTAGSHCRRAHRHPCRHTDKALPSTSNRPRPPPGPRPRPRTAHRRDMGRLPCGSRTGNRPPPPPSPSLELLALLDRRARGRPERHPSLRDGGMTDARHDDHLGIQPYALPARSAAAGLTARSCFTRHMSASPPLPFSPAHRH